MSTDDPTHLTIRSLIARRLVTRHGLDPLDAYHAVARVHRGMHTKHEALVRQEVGAIIDETVANIREAFAPIAAAMKTLGETMSHLVAQLPATPGRTARSRPAWQSPYGPPRKGHRR